MRAPVATDEGAWSQIAAKFERFGLSGWTFGDLPERVTISEGPDLPVYAWPSLELDSDHVNVRLFRNRETARREGLSGTQRLLEVALQRELGWLQKDLRAVARFQPLLPEFISVEELELEAFSHLRRYLMPAEPLSSLSEAQFQAALQTSRQRLEGLSHSFLERLGEILKLRSEVANRCVPSSLPKGRQTLAGFRELGSTPANSRGHPQIAADLAALLPKQFLQHTPFERLAHLPRYVKALVIRADRAELNPTKDQERARQLAPYLVALQTLGNAPERSAEGKKRLEEFRWMLEEFRVSLFAQELGTAVTVSPKRLDLQLEAIREAG
jgi:ATP-dependent helicase HrpA